MLNTLSAQRFVVTCSAPHGDIPLHAVLNRYRRPGRNGLNPGKPGAVVFLSHGAGHHKEIWEPTIAHLFELDDKSPSSGYIAEIWASDAPNHGESGFLNANFFIKYPDFSPVDEWGEPFVVLYNSGYIACLNPKIHDVVMVAHSAGSPAVTLATHYFPGPPSAIKYSSLILIEPAIVPQEMFGCETELYYLLKSMLPVRRDTWESREAAKSWMKTKIPWSLWDSRVLDAYIEHGLAPLPTRLYPNKKGVTLTAPKSEEAKVWECTTHALRALYRMNQIATTVPIHLIFGERIELYPVEAQDALHNPAEGRSIASVSRISNAGHLVAQEAPDALADRLYTIISGAKRPFNSKL